MLEQIVYLLSGIILSLEIILLIVGFYLSFKNKILISKTSSWFVIPVCILSLFIFILGYIYQNNGNLSLYIWSKSIEQTAKLFVFSFDVNEINDILSNNCLYLICYIIIVIMAMLTSLTTILGICKKSIVNFCRVSLAKAKGTDVVIGNSEKSLNYVRNTPGSILWITKPIKIYNDLYLKDLYYGKIPYVLSVFSKRTLKSFIWSKNKRYNFIIFKEENSLEYNQVVETLKKLKLRSPKNIFFYFETSKNEIAYLDNQFAKENLDVKIFTFDIYEKIALRFLWENSLPSLLPQGYIEASGTISSSKTINVLFFGYGRRNSALFKAMAISSQFAQFKNDHYCSFQINYYLFEVDEKKLCDPILLRLNEDYFDEDNFNSYSRMEKICNLEICNENIFSKNVNTNIKNIIEKKDSFTFAFVGYSEDLENISYAENLLHTYQSKKIKVFCNIDDEHNICKINYDQIVPYGLKNQIYSHKWIVDEKIVDYSIVKNFGKCITESNKYEALSKWENNSYYQKYLIIYSVLGLKYNLELLGLSLEEDENNKEALIEFKNAYDSKEQKENNFESMVKYIDHLLQCAFYYLNGFDFGFESNEKEKLCSFLCSYYSYILENKVNKNMIYNNRFVSYDACVLFLNELISSNLPLFLGFGNKFEKKL